MYVTDCGASGVVDADEGGEITSPNYPHDYPNNTNCFLRIRSDNGTIVLKIIDFYTEESDILTVGIKTLLSYVRMFKMC